MIGDTSALDWRNVGMIAMALVLFGIFYNTAIETLGQKLEGYTGLAVVFGVLVTLTVAVIVVPFVYILVLLVLFAASGTPMAVGSIWRYVRARQESLDTRRQTAVREAAHE
jgi:hypothetical protein